MHKQIVLAKRPKGKLLASDFELETVPLPTLSDGEVLVRNSYLSMDAGFRYWMNEGSGNNILPAMTLGEPVQGVVLGQVEASRNPRFQPGQKLMARLAWQEYSVLTPDNDAVYPVPGGWPCADKLFLGVLGETGMSAYIGTEDIGKLQPGQTALISAAAGAVGIVAGQISKIRGAKVIGIAGNDKKAQKLISEFGFDAVINYKTCGDLTTAIAEVCPDGIDFYFDNIGGDMLKSAIDNLAQGARIALCGAISGYDQTQAQPGPSNLFNLITKQATMTGLMTHFDAQRYNQIRSQLFNWLDSNQLKNAETLYQGIESAPAAFSAIFHGSNFGKSIVEI
ncbi:NADP-dependent oxidoreductase [Shewanella corallii]|uniref:NADP-dependent oxidoreductase n=1 Tax=Shewanella corallii TaxID=560080 RepID=A0ABT0NAW1_9GAMM|nr:NADP-dependent oxidoreductase [Shewanella corallii]MCL2915482.1 NADP-dependent oxidoreductase [Shewanella corallii]